MSCSSGTLLPLELEQCIADDRVIPVELPPDGVQGPAFWPDPEN